VTLSIAVFQGYTYVNIIYQLSSAVESIEHALAINRLTFCSCADEAVMTLRGRAERARVLHMYSRQSPGRMGDLVVARLDLQEGRNCKREKLPIRRDERARRSQRRCVNAAACTCSELL
jgi:hypothetical protein